MSEEEIRKACLDSGHQQEGVRLGEVCVPCMEYDNRRLRAELEAAKKENAKMLDHINERAAPPSDSIEELKRKNFEMYKHADDGWQTADALQSRLQAAERVVEAAKRRLDAMNKFQANHSHWGAVCQANDDLDVATGRLIRLAALTKPEHQEKL